MIKNVFGQSEWVGEGTLTMSVLEKPGTIRIKLKSFSTGEMALEIKADIIGDTIRSAYTTDPHDPEIIYLNSTLIGSIEGKALVDANFFGVEYGNEVLGYSGFEAYQFSDSNAFSYEGRFINCAGETCNIDTKCILYQSSVGSEA